MLTFLLSLVTLANSANSPGASICGKSDDRRLSSIAPVGRLIIYNQVYDSESVCSGALIGKNCFITAGHCMRHKSVSDYVEFNTPISINGERQPSAVEDRYEVDPLKIQKVIGGPGNDWAVIRLHSNPITNKWPGEQQGYYSITVVRTLPKDAMVRITGYGFSSLPERTYAQQTHVGKLIAVNPLKYQVDTKGSNSGSAVVLEETGEVIGVHSHGGCRPFGLSNTGTSLSNPEFFEAVSQCLAAEGN